MESCVVVDKTGTNSKTFFRQLEEDWYVVARNSTPGPRCICTPNLKFGRSRPDSPEYIMSCLEFITQQTQRMLYSHVLSNHISTDRANLLVVDA